MDEREVSTNNGMQEARPWGRAANRNFTLRSGNRNTLSAVCKQDSLIYGSLHLRRLKSEEIHSGNLQPISRRHQKQPIMSVPWPWATVGIVCERDKLLH
jgi:hypothetical protein